MTTHGVELALYEISTQGALRRRFVEDPEKVLQNYRLTKEEARQLRDLDVAALFRDGASPLALMGYWTMLRGPATMGDFLQAMPSLTDEPDRAP